MKKILNTAIILQVSIVLFLIVLFLMFITIGCAGPFTSQTDSQAQAEETQTVEPPETEAQAETGTETQDTGTSNTSTPEDVQEEQTPDRSEQLSSMFDELEKTAAGIGEIFLFIDQNIMDATPELATEMVYTAMRLCEDYKFDFTDKFNDAEVQDTLNNMITSPDQIDLDTLLDTDNQKVRDLIQETIDKKYKLLPVEGFIMALVDYSAYEEYRPYLTQEMNEYMDIKLDESGRPSVLDAGIVIPIDDFIARIIRSMDYVKDYPDSPRKDEVQEFNNGRIFIYLGGIDNSPVFDYEGRIIPEKLAEFEDNLIRYSDTEFGDMLGQYLDLLGQEDYMRTQKVDDFLYSLF